MREKTNNQIIWLVILCLKGINEYPLYSQSSTPPSLHRIKLPTSQKYGWLLLVLIALSYTQLLSQPSVVSQSKEKLGETVVANNYVLEITTLAPPTITKASPPQVLSLETTKKNLGPTPTRQLSLSKTMSVSTDGPFPPSIVPLLGTPKLASIPDKVAAQKPFKKNTGSTNLLSYDLTNGMRDLTVGRQYQDRHNNLWTTSIYSGAYKFDGKYFHYFTEAQGLSTNSVRTMAITQDDELWFGTLNGVTKYDGKYTTHYGPQHRLLSTCALHVEAGTNKTIWIGTCNGPQMIDRAANLLYSFPKIPEIKSRVYDLKIDSQGNVWMAFTSNKLAIITPEKRDTTYSFKAYVFDITAFGLGLYFFEEQAGGMWLGTKNGLFKFAPFDASKTNLVYQNYDSSQQIANQEITRIAEDKNQNIYVSTFKEGVFILERNQQQEVIQYNRLTAPADIPDSFVSTVFKDNKDNMWIGSNGLSILKNSAFEIFDPIKKPNCILEDAQKNIWIGSNNGLYLIKPSMPKNIFKYTTEEGLPHNSIMDIKVDKKGNIWMATFEKGIIKFDATNQQFFNYRKAMGLPSDYVTKLSIDQQNKVWFTTYTEATGEANNVGLSAINGRELIHLSKKKELFGSNMMTMTVDKFNNFWLGNWGGGVFKVDFNSIPSKIMSTRYKSPDLPVENRVRTMLADAKGNIWTGGYGVGGISQFIAAPDGTTTQIKNYSYAEGLSSSTLYSALEDSAGNLWFGTPNGLNALPADQVEQATTIRPIIQFTKEAGFPALGCRKNVLYQTSDGKIWVGGDDHLITFDPAVVLQKPAAPPLVLHEISLYNQPIDWQKDTTIILDNKISIEGYEYDSLSLFSNIPKGLSLAYNNNFIDFDYGAISIDNYQKVSYQTYLEGLESSWNVVSKEAKISYNGLKPGHYNFKVRAKKDGGDWGKALEYPFTIRPPWWLTWWAYLGYAVGAMAALYFGDTFLSRRRLAVAEAQRLKELDLVKSRLYTNITHEFRTPLTVISGMTTKIKQAPNDWLHKGLPMIERNSHQLLSLVNQLLDLSKLESGKMATNYRQGNIVNYLKYLVESMHSFASTKNITVHFFSETDVILMDFDEEKTQRIMVNLLSNAIKFTPPQGHIYVAVTQITATSNPTTPSLQIKIRDTGQGIAADQLPFIFDRFFQTDSSTTRKGEGTGIGLALVKELVHLLDGTISVKSKIQKETEFTLSLPIKQEAPALSQLDHLPKAIPSAIAYFEKDDPISSENGYSQVVDSNLKPSLLIVEDNADVVAYLRSCLEKDYLIQVGNDGAKGIAIALEHIPDIIITDIMMPIKDGIEVCNTLKNDERTSHIPIILLTAKADMESKLTGLENGADAYLSKPFHPKELLVRLEQLIENRKRLQAIYATAQLITEPTPKTEDVYLQKIQQAILDNLDENVFGPNELAQHLNTSRSQLHRKLKALTDISTSNYIKKIKLQEAKRLLIESEMTISEIAYAVGYASINYFSNSFSKAFGVSPRKFREQKADV